MHFPAPTQKPTAEDYAWARDLKTQDYRQKIDWALQQFALRGIGDIDFLVNYAGIDKKAIALLRNPDRKPRAESFNAFIDALIVTEDRVPESLWQRQDMFPWSPSNEAWLLLDMNIAGLTPSAVVQMRGVSNPQRSIGNKAKEVREPEWQQTVRHVYEMLDANPLSHEVMAGFFPYQPDIDPDNARSLLEAVWKRQEAIAVTDAELSSRIGYYEGKQGSQSYIRCIKSQGKFPSIESYAKIIRVLHQENAAAVLSPRFLDFVPFSEQRRDALEKLIRNIGMTQREIANGNFPRAYLSKKFAQQQPPSPENWSKVVLGVQQVYEEKYAAFMNAWRKLDNCFQFATHKRCQTYQTAQSTWQAIEEGHLVFPIPQLLLYPFIRAGITLGGKISQPARVEGMFIDAQIAVIADNIPLTDTHGMEYNAPAGAQVIAHRGIGYSSPVVVFMDKKECRHISGVMLPKGGVRYPGHPGIPTFDA